MNKSGIYKILNLVTNKVYIGSCINSLRIRFNIHKHHLRKGKHHSKKLQNSWNRHGEENFVFEVLEFCEPSKCIEREQYWIEFYNSYNLGYNCLPKAGNCAGRIVSEETKIKIRNKLKGKKCGRVLTKEEFEVLSNLYKKKQVLRFDLNNNLVDEWESAEPLSKELKVKRNSIYNAIRTDGSLKGFKFKYKNGNKLKTTV